MISKRKESIVSSSFLPLLVVMMACQIGTLEGFAVVLAFGGGGGGGGGGGVVVVPSSMTSAPHYYDNHKFHYSSGSSTTTNTNTLTRLNNNNDNDNNSNNDNELEQQQQKQHPQQQEAAAVALKDILHDLDTWNVRYRPSAKRMELERMWKEERQNQNQRPRGTHSQTQRQQQQQRQQRQPRQPSPTTSTTTSTTTTNTASCNVSTMSLAELLQTLDDYSIRYEPRATRKDLETLLEQQVHDHQQQHQQQQRSSMSPSMSSSTSSDAVPSDAKPVGATTTATGTTELMERIQLRGDDINITATTILAPGMETTPSTIRQTGSVLLPSIPPPPLTTNSSHSSNIETMQKQTATTKATEPTTTATANVTHETDEMVRRRQRRRYVRQQERLSKPSSSPIRGTGTVLGSAVIKSVVQPQLYDKLPIISSLSSLEDIQKTTHYVTRKARRVSQKAQDWWTMDENGIRNAKYEYVQKEDPVVQRKSSKVIEVQAEPIPRRRRPGPPSPPPSHQQNRSETTWRTTPVEPITDSWDDDTADFRRRRRRQSPSTKSTPTSTTFTTTSVRNSGDRGDIGKRQRPERPDTCNSEKRPVSRSQAAARSNLWASTSAIQKRNKGAPLALQRSSNPSPATTTIQSSSSSSSLPPQSPSRKTSSRRVYSPYADQAGFKDDDNRDAFDRLGEYLADVADRVMWGKYDHDDVDDRATNKATAPTTAGERRYRNPQRPQHEGRGGVPRTHSRHWKDRMEERLDSLLGIHQHGKYYDSWMSRRKQEDQDKEGTDAFSYARGRTPRKGGYDRPIWEEEGTLWTLLFGKAAPGKRLQFRDTIDGEPGQLLGVVKACFRTVLVGMGYACRWASVRGTLPQPVVVMAVSTAALSVRKHRIRAVVLVLLGLRTFGELIHGYVLGDDGWEYQEDDE